MAKFTEELAKLPATLFSPTKMVYIAFIIKYWSGKRHGQSLTVSFSGYPRSFSSLKSSTTTGSVSA